MPRAKSKPKTLNDERPEVIEDNWLDENCQALGVPTAKEPVIVANEIPKMETFTFINNRDPGCTLYFHYHSKTSPLKHYTLVHGHQHTLPSEVVRWLEGESKIDPWSCHTRKYGRRMREDGVSETFANAYVPNFQCKAVRV